VIRGRLHKTTTFNTAKEGEEDCEREGEKIAGAALGRPGNLLEKNTKGDLTFATPKTDRGSRSREK